MNDGGVQWNVVLLFPSAGASSQLVQLVHQTESPQSAAALDASTSVPSPPWIIIRGLTIAWALNLLAFPAAIIWLFIDPLAPRFFAIWFRPWNQLPVELMLDMPYWRVLIGCLTLMFTSIGLIFIAAALFLGPRTHRRLRSWLALTTLVALWLALFASWREFAWAGARWRLGQELDQFEPVAAALRHQWPKQDDDIPGLGYFTAYPSIEATTLLVISDDAPPGRAPIAAVEHSDAGALRFQLAGDETGAWLEWHPAASQPASFKGGLDTKYILDRTSSLGDGWFLSRYH
jgi:hypothetical protein